MSLDNPPLSRQIDDLARLYWHRERLERAETGMMRRASRAVEDWQNRRRQEVAGATFDVSHPEILNVFMSESADPGVRLRRLLSFLEITREQAKPRTFHDRQVSVLEPLYQGGLGWRQGRLLSLLRLCRKNSETPTSPQSLPIRELVRTMRTSTSSWKSTFHPEVE